ncbi:arsenite-transporting ATPase [Geomicrobium halophilum]|uniref:Arsenite-transporting ATPase n=1 Tax=Geomicrobium halophilum TaxID=549000 RepID=A0A841PLZ4_9BACL|nr:arsenical pump-driving ATPase [Geomicrobium halophilum]MBB6449780.1 arsenite-transporting ATPase [Geomicrobium halophilum]
MYPRFEPSVVERMPFIFFTGKGGVGKTSTASATAVALADAGKKVLLVSTDPASNLQDVFSQALSNEPKELDDVKGLSVCNLDPEEAAREYRESVVAPYRGTLPEVAITQMEEQLAGACTVEIAAFDEFTGLLAKPDIHKQYDHIIFDTAPTGHTLRLLKLPTAWSGYLDESKHGASCLGPLTGLDEKKDTYETAVEALSNNDKTLLVLVTRPETSAMSEASRASKELQGVGIDNQCLIMNGVYDTVDQSDHTSKSLFERQQQAIKERNNALQPLRTFMLPLVSFPLTGIDHLRKLYSDETSTKFLVDEYSLDTQKLHTLPALVQNYAEQSPRVIMTMGKGGVGKTTLASMLAVGLVEKGNHVHLTTTDPASHLYERFNGSGSEKLKITQIDPVHEVQEYKEKVLQQAGPLDEEAKEYLEEDLRSPCTEEIAVFQAFAKVVDASDDEIVIIDTAPTGHTLLLLDAAQSYHQEIQRSTGEVPESVEKLLPRLRNPEETDILLVSLPEATPVYEARRLQDDLKRAGITANHWVINQSLYETHTTESVLAAKAQYEKRWIKEVNESYSTFTVVMPWQAEDTIGYDQMKQQLT